MSTTYTITAGDNSTDLGIVGRANTLLGAKRIGRKAVREMLPNGHGSYRIFGLHNDSRGEAYGLRTGHKWVSFS